MYAPEYSCPTNGHESMGARAALGDPYLQHFFRRYYYLFVAFITLIQYWKQVPGYQVLTILLLYVLKPQE